MADPNKADKKPIEPIPPSRLGHPQAISLDRGAEGAISEAIREKCRRLFLRKSEQQDFDDVSQIHQTKRAALLKLLEIPESQQIEEVIGELIKNDTFTYVEGKFLEKNITAVRAYLQQLLILESEDGGIGVTAREPPSASKVNLTRFDLFAIPEEIEMASLIEKSLKISDYSEQEMERLSRCFVSAKQYLNDYLHLSLPHELANWNGFKNKEDVAAYFNKLRPARSKDRVGYLPYYCALAKITFCFWEFEENEMQNLVHQAEWLHQGLQHPEESGLSVNDPEKIIRFVPNNISLSNESETGADSEKDAIDILPFEGDSIKTLTTYRGKNPDRTITKMLSKPEFDLQKAIGDGIGIRFEVDTREQALELVLFLKQYLFADEDRVKLRDYQFLSQLPPEDQSLAMEMFSEAGIGLKEKSNAATSDQFESISLSGEIAMPVNPSNPQSMTDYRPLELQVVLRGNKNEHGYNGHEVYEAKQKLQAVSRLFGTFTEDYLNLICAEASAQTKGKLSAEGIKDNILDRGFITPVKIKGERRQKSRYYWTSHLDRLKKTEMLSPAIITRDNRPDENQEANI